MTMSRAAATVPDTLSAAVPSFVRRMSLPASMRPAILAVPVKLAITSPLVAEIIPPRAMSNAPTRPSVTVVPAMRPPRALMLTSAVLGLVKPIVLRAETRPSITALVVAASVTSLAETMSPRVVRLLPVRLTRPASTVPSTVSAPPASSDAALLVMSAPPRVRLLAVVRLIAPGLMSAPKRLADWLLAVRLVRAKSAEAAEVVSAPFAAASVIASPLSIEPVPLMASAPVIAVTVTAPPATTSPVSATAPPRKFTLVATSTKPPMLARPPVVRLTLPVLLVSVPLLVRLLVPLSATLPFA